MQLLPIALQYRFILVLGCGLGGAGQVCGGVVVVVADHSRRATPSIDNADAMELVGIHLVPLLVDVPAELEDGDFGYCGDRSARTEGSIPLIGIVRSWMKNQHRQ